MAVIDNSFVTLQLTVIHPQMPQETKIVSSKVDTHVEAKDSHLKIGVHGVEQPLFNSDSSDKKGNFLLRIQDQSTFHFSVVVGSFLNPRHVF